MNWLRNIFNVCFLGVLFFLLAFTNVQQDAYPCKGVSITLENEAASFVTRGEVLQIINSLIDSIDGLPLNELPLYEMEKTIEQHALIKAAEVFVLPNGELNVTVAQKEPLVRVQNAQGKSYYLDIEGKPFPLSRNYTQRLMVANGNIIDSVDIAVVCKVAKYIYQNEFWKAQIMQLYINDNKEIELIPRVGNHIILLGSEEEMETKFEKLMLFYQKGVQQTGWNKYSIINLKYKNQLVCVKR
tara:strand:+ start:181 stop:906 length:726 start_codon:yes stop_codon:yes gene_type:complete